MNFNHTSGAIMNSEDTKYAKTQGGRSLQRGYTNDPECHRTTYRLGLASRLLAADGITITWEHSSNQGIVGTGLLQRRDHVCDGRCKPIWPEHVTGAMFDLAYKLADEMQTERGAYHQHKINEARRAR